MRVLSPAEFKVEAEAGRVADLLVLHHDRAAVCATRTFNDLAIPRAARLHMQSLTLAWDQVQAGDDVCSRRMRYALRWGSDGR